MDMDTRFQIMALVNEIIDPETRTFNLQSAKRIIELLPVSEKKIELSFRKVRKEKTVIEYGSNVGDIEIDNRDNAISKTFNGFEKNLVGGFEIAHVPGIISINVSPTGAYEDEANKECVLVYDKKTGEPKVLKEAVERSWSLKFPRLFSKGWVTNTFSLVTYGHWKHPEAPNPPPSPVSDL